jgi:hypothetical protein
MRGFAEELRRRVEVTQWADTREHLVEERSRRLLAGEHVEVPCADASLLFWDYAGDDLAVAGMPAVSLRRFFEPDVPPGDKWRLVEPYWNRCGNTGVLQAVRITAQKLFDEADLDARSFTRISERMAAWQPGFYRHVARTAGVTSCQVNSLEAIFCQSEQPDLLRQDICISWLSHRPDLADLARQTGIHAVDLPGMHQVIDWFFDRYGDAAVAVKSLGAYSRRLDYDSCVPEDLAAVVFERYARGENLPAADDKLLQDHLMNYCIVRATAHRLPIKLHCGYYGGRGVMPLERVRRNAADLCPLLMAHPNTTFVLMHMGYPYQDEYIALAKHFPNAVIDLSFAWILNPAATTRFVAEFLTSAPATKLLTFGGDYRIIESVVGHAQRARHGLCQALRQTVKAGWLTGTEAVDLVEPLMHGNALLTFLHL